MSTQRIFKITDGIFTQQVKPINDSKLAYSWEFDQKKVYYTRKLKTKLKFSNDAKAGVTDFDFFYAILSNPSIACVTLALIIYKVCDGVEQQEWIGEFTSTDFNWDLDNCTCELTPRELNPYTCLEKNKSVEVNALDVPNIVSTSADLNYNLEFYYCSSLVPAAPCAPVDPNSTWANYFLDNSVAISCGINQKTQVWYREYAVTACVGGVPNPPSGAGWFLETNNCGTLYTSKWVRYPLMGSNPNAGNIYRGFYNANTGLPEPPPAAFFRQINVSNTPASPTQMFLGPWTMHSINIGGGYDIFEFEVLLNPNSTYVWSLDGSSPLSANVFGAGNKVKVQPLVNVAGNVIIKLVETHGNGWVSQQLYTLAQNNLPVAGNLNTTMRGYGKTTTCANTIDTIICSNVPTDYLGNPRTILWGITGNGTIISSSGNTCQVQAGTSGAYNVTATITIPVGPLQNVICKYIHGCSITCLPETAPFYTITDLYPLEPSYAVTLHNSGNVFSWWNYRTYLGSGLNVGTSNFMGVTGIAGGGTMCIALKEYVNCGGSCCNLQILVQPYSVANPLVIKTDPYYECPLFVPNVNYTRNRLFFEVCEYVLTKMGCSTTQIVSDFFEWNPVGDTVGYVAGTNYVTGLANQLRYLTISQKSDVISPTSTNAATKGLITWEKITQLWATMFNAYWFVDSSNRVRVEHISWFNRVVAYDTTAAPHSQYNTAKNKFTFDKSKMPRFEKFLFSEQRTTDIAGAEIYYDSLCVNQDATSNREENAIPFVTSDLYFIAQSPSEIDPNGFVLFCNTFDGVNYAVAVEAGNITGNLGANFHLGWANLHVNYHKYRRVLLTGYMNNILTTFVTARRTKQQKDLVLVFCCDDTFDPQSILIKSELGNGIVESADHEVKKGIIKVNLLHNNNF